MIRIAEYLKALGSAHRTLSMRASRCADYWWDTLTPVERVLAYDLLAVTGIEPWCEGGSR